MNFSPETTDMIEAIGECIGDSEQLLKTMIYDLREELGLPRLPIKSAEIERRAEVANEGIVYADKQDALITPPKPISPEECQAILIKARENAGLPPRDIAWTPQEQVEVDARAVELATELKNTFASLEAKHGDKTETI